MDKLNIPYLTTQADEWSPYVPKPQGPNGCEHSVDCDLSRAHWGRCFSFKLNKYLYV